MAAKSKTMVFRGAYIRFGDQRFDADNGIPFYRIHFTSDFSEPVMEEMSWSPSVGVISGKLTGEIPATKLVLVPNGTDMKKFGIELEAQEVVDFQFFRMLNGDGDIESTELRFTAITKQKGAARKIEDYLNTVGQGVAQLKVGVDVSAQEDLPLAEKQERLISDEQAAETKAEDGGTLASAANAAGGTHQRKQRPENPVQ